MLYNDAICGVCLVFSDFLHDIVEILDWNLRNYKKILVLLLMFISCSCHPTILAMAYNQK